MKLYDVLLLKDGRKGAVVEIFDDACEVDVGSSPKDWDTITVNKDDLRVIGSV